MGLAPFYDFDLIPMFDKIEKNLCWLIFGTFLGLSLLKDSYQVLVVACVSVFIGVVLYLLSRSVGVPSPYNPFLTSEAFFAMDVLFFWFWFRVAGSNWVHCQAGKDKTSFFVIQWLMQS